MPAASSRAAARSTRSGAEIVGRGRGAWPRGEPTKSEALGHQEFVLGYKPFEPLGPACFPG